MRAVTCHDGRLAVTDVPTPAPGPGQLLLAVTRCGICGSDLHARTNADASADIAAEVGYPHFMRSRDHVVLGHEFTGTVVDYGPGCRRRWPTGRPVVALPALRHGGDVHLIGLSERAPGVMRSTWWSPRMSRCRCPTVSRRTWPRSPSRWPSRTTRSVGARSGAATSPS
ncbi:MAG: alcohol dehydrogenase catalytic domain-containing protein [Austwickia sp.]|nr:alcohol dehydrogenase catalytic domain-containing protein [Austwickia sp.]